MLGGEHAVGEPAVDDERRALDARLVAFLVLDDLDLELMTLCPAQVHAEQHVGPVLGFGSPGAGVEGHDRVALVVLAAEQRPDLELLDARAQRSDPVFQLLLDARIVFGLRELVQDRQVLVLARELVVGLHVVLEAREARQQRFGGRLVVPEIRCAGFLLELGYRRALRVDVKDRPWRRRAPFPRPRAPRSDQPPCRS